MSSRGKLNPRPPALLLKRGLNTSHGPDGEEGAHSLLSHDDIGKDQRLRNMTELEVKTLEGRKCHEMAQSGRIFPPDLAT